MVSKNSARFPPTGLTSAARFWNGSRDPFRHAGETIRPPSRTFIPVRLVDNPHLMATGYGATLQAMPEPLRSQRPARERTTDLATSSLLTPAA
jgi:hypothetical protein